MKNIAKLINIEIARIFKSYSGEPKAINKLREGMISDYNLYKKEGQDSRLLRKPEKIIKYLNQGDAMLLK